MIEEWGCSLPIKFITSDGVRRIEPGKIYNSKFIEQPECIKLEDSIEKITPPLISSKMAKSVYKKADGFKRMLNNISGINEELLGPIKSEATNGKEALCTTSMDLPTFGIPKDLLERHPLPECMKLEYSYQKLAKEYLEGKERWETDPSEKISIECFASWLDRR